MFTTRSTTWLSHLNCHRPKLHLTTFFLDENVLFSLFFLMLWQLLMGDVWISQGVHIEIFKVLTFKEENLRETLSVNLQFMLNQSNVTFFLSDITWSENELHVKHQKHLNLQRFQFDWDRVRRFLSWIYVK